ncbi:MAG: hypothetical protein ACMG5Z_03680 [Luteimonas sp.]
MRLGNASTQRCGDCFRACCEPAAAARIADPRTGVDPRDLRDCLSWSCTIRGIVMVISNHTDVGTANDLVVDIHVPALVVSEGQAGNPGKKDT